MSDATLSDDLLYFNGINAASGEYDTPPLSLDALATLAKGEKLDQEQLEELKKKHNDKVSGLEHFSAKEGTDPKDLATVGWGVIFAFADNDKLPAIKDALKPLLDWRRAQATKHKAHYYKEYSGPTGYRPSDSKNDWLTRQGAGPGPADPEKVPYYLLIVGDPDTIPYRFQFQLDVQYAVGRIHFDTPNEYATYAQRVVQAESQAPFLAPRATFFNVSNPDDRATQLSAQKLIAPLSTSMAADKPNWQYSVLRPEESTKERLGQILGGADTPALLFTASHGMGFPLDHERQLRHQGALLCQNWPGPRGHRGPIPESYYFSADDVASNANLLGMMAFFFACYGAGTPKLDEFAHKMGQRPQIAPSNFLARLPRKLLTQGALSVVGHVERAWGTSFMWDRAGVQVGVFESSFKRLMEGHPVGSAFEYFNERYAEISSDLSSYLEELNFGEEVNKEKLAGMWTANNDARSYVVIGDPATRLPIVTSGAPAAERPALTAVAISTSPAAAPPPTSAPQPTGGAETTDGPVNYGLGDVFNQTKSGLEELVEKLTKTLNQMVDDITSLEVKTYMTEDLNAVKYNAETRDFQGAKLRAMTRISLDGDVVNCVPERNGKVDESIWNIHLSMVQQAQANRSEMIKTAVGLLGSLKSF